MTIGTYTELKTAVANWLNRSDLTGRDAEFIANFEAYFTRKCRVRQMMQRDQDTTFSAEYTALPTGYLQMVSLKLTGSTIYSLSPAPSMEWIDENYTDGTAGPPKFFCVNGTELRVAPAPDATYTAEMTYYKFSALSDSNTTNWLLTNHPDLYLKGSLVEAEAYLVNDPRVAMWKSFRDEAISELITAEKRAQWSGGVLRVRPDRIA